MLTGITRFLPVVGDNKAPDVFPIDCLVIAFRTLLPTEFATPPLGQTPPLEPEPETPEETLKVAVLCIARIVLGETFNLSFFIKVS
jgi:hypothetical protein